MRRARPHSSRALPVASPGARNGIITPSGRNGSMILQAEWCSRSQCRRSTCNGCSGWTVRWRRSRSSKGFASTASCRKCAVRSCSCTAKATSRFRLRSRRNVLTQSAPSTRRSRFSPARKAAFIIVRWTMSPSACTPCGTGSPMCCTAVRSGGLGPVYHLDPIENLAQVPPRNLNVVALCERNGVIGGRIDVEGGGGQAGHGKAAGCCDQRDQAFEPHRFLRRGIAGIAQALAGEHLVRDRKAHLLARIRESRRLARVDCLDHRLLDPDAERVAHLRVPGIARIPV